MINKPFKTIVKFRCSSTCIYYEVTAINDADIKSKNHTHAKIPLQRSEHLPIVTHQMQKKYHSGAKGRKGRSLKTDEDVFF